MTTKGSCDKNVPTENFVTVISVISFTKHHQTGWRICFCQCLHLGRHIDKIQSLDIVSCWPNYNCQTHWHLET